MNPATNNLLISILMSKIKVKKWGEKVLHTNWKRSQRHSHPNQKSKKVCFSLSLREDLYEQATTVYVTRLPNIREMWYGCSNDSMNLAQWFYWSNYCIWHKALIGQLFKEWMPGLLSHRAGSIQEKSRWTNCELTKMAELGFSDWLYVYPNVSSVRLLSVIELPLESTENRIFLFFIEKTIKNGMVGQGDLWL